MRDRLIELLNKKYDHFCDQCGVNKDSHYTDSLADYLISNGVIVPPCKVGDVVYLIPTFGGRAYCGVVQDNVQLIGITSRGVHIKARNHQNYNKMYMIGKSAFLAKEEAERALKERERG